MAQLIFAPSIQALDANGAPYSGAKLYTYVASTTTPLTVYQDNTLLTPHANPVVADSSGRFAPIYTSSTSLKVVLATSADVTIQTVDPVVFSIGLGIADAATATMMTTATTSLTLGVQNQNFTIQHVDSDRTMVIAGGSGGSGSKLTLYGQSHATQAYDFTLTGSAANVPYQWDDSASNHLFSSGGSANLLFGQGSTAAPGAGNNTVGIGFQSTGAFSASTSGGHTINKTSDGTVLSISSGGTAQGSISIAGAVTSYNAFFGSHWSQLAVNSRPEILVGTICESIDEMLDWGDAFYPDENGEMQKRDEPAQQERLPRFKVSDVPGSKRVYGVFHIWEEDENYPDCNHCLVGSLGAYFIRIAAGETVLRGDLIESNGNGCGRVQADDLMRSSTVAKVTSATIVETYPDGSYLVPCTLHCG